MSFVGGERPVMGFASLARLFSVQFLFVDILHLIVSKDPTTLPIVFTRLGIRMAECQLHFFGWLSCMMVFSFVRIL